MHDILAKLDEKMQHIAADVFPARKDVTEAVKLTRDIIAGCITRLEELDKRVNNIEQLEGLDLEASSVEFPE